MTKFLSVLFVACGLQMSANAQENSPYSRYALGDLAPNHNIFTRAMGGISAGVIDYQSINFTNPAATASISNTILDLGVESTFRTLKSTSPAKKHTSTNIYFSYMQLGFPLTTKKMAKKKMLWGMSFGIKPVTKINYKIEKNERLPGIDSLHTLYEGSGGANQALIGTALKIKNFSIGFNIGYMFGSKDYSTRLTFINDTTYYYQSNSQTQTTFGGFSGNVGMQYEKAFKRDERGNDINILRLGLYGNWQQNLKANSDIVRETFYYGTNGSPSRLDSVYEEKDVQGKIQYPAMVGFGFTYENIHWMYGADFEYGNWNNYRYYGQADDVQNNWILRAGAQYYPFRSGMSTKKYFNFVKYRAGLYYGPDYIKVNNSRPEYGFTIGTGMPLTSLRRISYTGEYVVLNTALEIGSRGNKQTNVRENIIRFNFGVSMNARWFQKSKYY